jgi:hypothetical protein
VSLRDTHLETTWKARIMKASGLVVVGVHTPEFPFEKDVENVRRAVKDMRVDYPVAIDSDYAIWRAFNNQYWPALYFAIRRGIFAMVKDSKKYASTGGWGFAQFDKDGRPADEALLKTCFPCHEPAKARDFVFTRYAP